MTDESPQLSAWRPLPCRGPDAQLFAIGDVHGQAGALSIALDAIARIPRIGLPRRLVFLGDLIDRGPDSLGAVRLAMGASDRARVDEVILLPGNHELLMIDGLLDPQEFMGDWLDIGGDAVIQEADPGCTARKLTDLAEIARAAFDPAFLTAMTSGPTFHRTGELLLVHAGLAPGVEAEKFLAQGRFGSSGEHWAWIREPFLDWEFGWGPDRSWAVIHGHTPAVNRRTKLAGFSGAADRVQTRRRLCLDAGAAYGHPQVGWAEFGLDRYRVGLARQSI
jgi:serine/threonine protein phosphatase 1